jgi:aspartate ammonia-lyase
MHMPTPVPDRHYFAGARADAAPSVEPRGQARRADVGELGAEPQRFERDPIGERAVPLRALYGIQTARALDTFQISTVRVHPALITAFAEIKKAAALANVAAGSLDDRRGRAIIRAADEVIAGQWRDHFPLDAFQAGAGTSTNMNANEVIANRALEILGHGRGEYGQLHPNDHVNRSQSTNDTMPTAMRIAALRLIGELSTAIDGLVEAFQAKAFEWAEVRKAGRTHLHDATPMTLGQECAGYAANIRRAGDRLRVQESLLAEVPLGGTAIGTGINTPAGFAALAVAHLGAITGLPLREAPDRIASQQSLGDFVAVSGALRGLAVELGKIANDLRLLSSGPHTGLDEIELPALQPGSSIMPGKVNPVVAEMMNMVCFHVIGHDVAIAMAGEAGQLELNVMLPYVAYALLDSLDVMTHAVATFDRKTVRLLKAHPDRCAHFAERTVGAATALNAELGFQGAAEVAQEAIRSGRTVADVVAERRRATAGRMG